MERNRKPQPDFDFPGFYTHAGVWFSYPDFTSDDIRLDDIAHHLSLDSRFGGATSVFFSVAEHSLHCQELVVRWQRAACFGPAEEDRLRLLALLHDAHEAYTKDFPTGLKTHLSGIAEFQSRVDRAVYEAFDIDPPTDEERGLIKEVDSAAALAEARLLMPAEFYFWFRRRLGISMSRGDAPTVYDDPPEVERIFKNRVLLLL